MGALWDEIRADAYRCEGRTVNGLGLAVLLYRDATLRPVVTLRLVRHARVRFGRLAGPVGWPLRRLHRWAQRQAGVDLPAEAHVGSGLRILHGWGLVVSPGAVIGDNVTLFHGVTLGQKDVILADGRRMTGYPVLEDEVWVGPHAIVVGAVRVGRGARVAGGAVVTRDVEPYTIVGGNPGRVLSEDALADVANRAGVMG
jgi:serine O-acetyltransferase